MLDIDFSTLKPFYRHDIADIARCQAISKKFSTFELENFHQEWMIPLPWPPKTLARNELRALREIIVKIGAQQFTIFFALRERNYAIALTTHH
jgi:hypothetical protein